MIQNEILTKIINNAIECYDYEQYYLHNLSLQAKTEGEIREAAGNLVEKVLQNIFDSINEYFPDLKIVSKVGSTDFLSKEIIYKGRNVTFNKIQVDRHVWVKGENRHFQWLPLPSLWPLWPQMPALRSSASGEDRFLHRFPPVP